MLFERFISVFLTTCLVLSTFSLAPSHFSAAYAAPKTAIAVLDFTAKGGVTVDEASIITDRIRTQVFRSGEYRVMERADMLSIIKEQGFQQTQSNCESTDCSVEIGKLLAVRQIMTGSVSKLGSIYTLSLRMIDVEKGTIVQDEYRDCRCELEEILTRVSHEMVVQLMARSNSEGLQAIAQATPVPQRSQEPSPFRTPAPPEVISGTDTTRASEIAQFPLAVRTAYYDEHKKEPFVAVALNILPFPAGYIYADDWGKFWLWSLVQTAFYTTATMFGSNIIGLGALIVSLGIYIFNMFDAHGMIDTHNQALKQRLLLPTDQNTYLPQRSAQAELFPLFQMQVHF